MRVWWEGMPATVRLEIEREGLQFYHLPFAQAPIDAAHIFVTERACLEARLRQLLPLLERAGFLWVSWPKKAAGLTTDITEDVIRDVVLPMQLVDVKVCSVDDMWSGLKLLIRKEHR